MPNALFDLRVRSYNYLRTARLCPPNPFSGRELVQVASKSASNKSLLILSTFDCLIIFTYRYVEFSRGPPM